MIASDRVVRRLVWPLVLVAVLGRQTPSAVAGPASDRDRPRELGRIAWVRGFDAGIYKSRAEHKPILVLFQEVPGCRTCVDYGQQVLSHPLIVDAIQTLFVPVAIYNNLKGADEQALKTFKEPAWNNPVVRIVTADRRPLARRVAKDYTVAALASAMVDALRKSGRDVPTYLRLLDEELASRKRGLARATFAMHCFWEGEGALGSVSGVVSTVPGFLGKEEVVEVEFDPKTIGYAALVRKAQSLDCASSVYTRSEEQDVVARRLAGSSAVRTDQAVRRDKTPKYYLSNTAYRYVPMTGLQSARVNAALGRKGDPSPSLSPGQLAMFRVIRGHPSAGWPDAIGAKNLPEAWRAAEAVARSFRK